MLARESESSPFHTASLHNFRAVDVGGGNGDDDCDDGDA